VSCIFSLQYGLLQQGLKNKVPEKSTFLYFSFLNLGQLQAKTAKVGLKALN